MCDTLSHESTTLRMEAILNPYQAFTDKLLYLQSPATHRSTQNPNTPINPQRPAYIACHILINSRASQQVSLTLTLWLILAFQLMAEPKILVIQSHDSLPYQQALQGFKNSLTAHDIQANYEETKIPEAADSLASQLQTSAPQLILTLGTPATRLCLAQTPTIPMVATLLLDTNELQQNAHATGVGLNFSATTQWLWLRRLLPEARRIAVIYDPKHNQAFFQNLQRQADSDNISLSAIAASSSEDLADLQQNLPSQLDAIWAIDGSVAFSPTTVRELLLFSFRNRIPLIGLSAQWVKAGALYALDWDYIDLGEQAAELALKILQKTTPGDDKLAPLEPRKVRPIYNTKTAEHMKLTEPNRWLPEMAEVFR